LCYQEIVCSRSPDPPDDLTGVQTKQIKDVIVSVAILTDEQTESRTTAA